MAGDKRRLFGMDEEELADALEAIYKRQKATDEKVDQILAHLIALRTSVVQDPNAVPGGDEGEGVPPLVRWALTQPWGQQLMTSLTDQQMLQGLGKNLIDWLKQKAAQKINEAAANAAAGVKTP